MASKKQNQTVEKRKAKTKQDLINVLKEMPIIEVAVKRIGISRDTFYRWKLEDKVFAKQSQEAFVQGIEFINDMSESQLVSLIKEKSWQAIQFWLKHHHARYADKIEISGKIESEEKLTPEQATIVKAALRLANFSKKHE